MNGLVKFLLWAAAIVGALGAIVYYALLDAWVVPTDDPQLAASIEPTLSAGDTVLISRHGTPAFANLVRCADPDAPGRFVIGRLIGNGGDKVEIASESLTINGAHAPTPRGCAAARQTVRNPATNDDEELACWDEEMGGSTHSVLRSIEHPEGSKVTDVEGGKVYLVSDDRHIHLDSRDYGAIDGSTCKHIVYRLWSAQGYGDSKRRLTLIW